MLIAYVGDPEQCFVQDGEDRDAQLSHNQSPVIKWIEKAAAPIYSWDCPLLPRFRLGHNKPHVSYLGFAVADWISSRLPTKYGRQLLTNRFVPLLVGNMPS